MNKGNWIKKLIASILGLFVFTGVMLVLTHTAQNSVATTQILPTINPDPVYVECLAGEEREITWKAKEDFSVSGFTLLLVNVSSESQGTFRMKIWNSDKELIFKDSLAVNEIEPGKWTVFPAELSFQAGEEYRIVIEADASEPYFMQVPDGWGENLPFEETVWENGEALSCGISVGIEKVEPVRVTYGDIFYYSIPVSILLLIGYLLFIWVGKERLPGFAGRIPVREWIGKYGSDIFLILLFGMVCILIYSKAYLNGIYISADSTGYLEEAENLVQGNGFQYDGLAGYRSWFANWPVLYPACIAAVMLVTKVNAYLASKILAMLIAGLLLILMRVCFRKDAWIYALCLTNIGFLDLCYYTWSEVPFILFLFGFGLVLARILKEDHPGVKWYVLLGIMGVCSFLTRYFGIYVWIVTGVYICALLWKYYKEREKSDLHRAVRLGITAVVSGILSVGYLMMNKIMNGMASGVSRTMWWDDFRTLTDDLIQSLLTEFFHIFSLQIPEYMENFPYKIKLFVVWTLIICLIILIIKRCKHFSLQSVMITMAVMYYGIFIAIRYVSSMDTFYFRFFEPATFLLCIGVIGLLLPDLKSGSKAYFFGGAVSVCVILSIWSVLDRGELAAQQPYYEAVTEQWEQAYAEIPQKSVIIFNDIDYRSSWYRPDVVDGTITPQDTKESVKQTYYGSEYLCIRRTFVEEMLSSGEYNKEIQDWLSQGLRDGTEERKFVVLPLQ
ncbi:MAG: hypothetical protein Q4E29_13145 [Lachnospiraceae bacterium]|nr:hypothetical protein [Lachnospiraceae bacterium]